MSAAYGYGGRREPSHQARRDDQRRERVTDQARSERLPLESLQVGESAEDEEADKRELERDVDDEGALHSNRKPITRSMSPSHAS